MSEHTQRSISLALRTSYDELPLLRHVIRQTLPPLSQDQQSRYLGAVTEIAVNAIDASKRAETIRVTLVLAPRPSVTISDFGSGFDPAHPPASDSDSLGQGLTIAAASVPGIIIDSSPSGTSVTLPYPAAEQIAS